MGKKKSGLIQRYTALWTELSGKKLFLFYVLHYTIAFLILQRIVFAEFYEGGKLFLWTMDGMPLRFTRLAYIGKVLCDGIQALLAEQAWVFPLFDFNIGYVKPDFQIELMNLLSVLWPKGEIESLYNFIVLARYYLVGLSFSIFGFYWKQSPFSIFIGAIAYVFCGYKFYSGVRHPFFLVPMIYLPLLILLTEEILKKKKAHLFVVLVFLASVFSVYFAYMMGLQVVLYAVVRYFTAYKGESWKGFAGMIGRLFLRGGIGLFMGAMISVPTFFQIIGTERVGGRDMSIYGNMLHYETWHYSKLLSGFLIAPGTLGAWTCLGFAVLALPAVFALFIERDKKKKTLCWLFAIMTIMLSIPAIAFVFSGFDAFSNRWSFGYSFCVAAIVMFMIPWFSEGAKREHFYVNCVILAYVCVCCVAVHPDYVNGNMLILLLLQTFLFTFLRAFRKKKRFAIQICCLCFTVVSVVYTSYLQYSPEQENYIEEFSGEGEAIGEFEDSQYASFAKSSIQEKDQSFYRVGSGDVTRSAINSSFYYDVKGTSGFSGLYDKYPVWLRELETGNRGMIQETPGSDARAMQLALESIKYYLVRENEGAVVPYGFEEIERIENRGNVDILYRNKYALPVGYTYDAYVDAATYDKMNATQKQEAQMQAVVLDKVPQKINLQENGEFDSLAKQCPVEIEDSMGIIWKDGQINVLKENAKMVLSFEGLPNAETYVRIVNLDLTDKTSTRRWRLEANTEDTRTTSQFLPVHICMI